MKPIRNFLRLGVFIFSATALGKGAPQGQPPQRSPTIASIVDLEISKIERQVVDAAEAMPAEKFNFSPESLNISGSNYKGVRTFALQVKHIAASNYFLWSPLTGDQLPADLKDGNGPEDVKTKAEILKFLKDSFALGHKAAATLTTQNMLHFPERSQSTRVDRATFAVAHAELCDNLLSVETLITREPLAIAGGIARYFRWTGPSRQRFSACDSWDEYRAQTGGRK